MFAGDVQFDSYAKIISPIVVIVIIIAFMASYTILLVVGLVLYIQNYKIQRQLK